MSFRLPPHVELATLLALLGALGIVVATVPPLDPLAAGVVTPALAGLLAGFALLLGLDLALTARPAKRQRRASRSRLRRR